MTTSTPHSTRPRRPRRIALAALAAAAVAVLTGCSGAASAPAETTAASTSWTFTDDLGKKVTLDHRPTRVAGLTDVLFSLMNYGLKPVAAWGYSGLKKDVRFDDLDTKGIAEVGTTYGEINLESLAAAKPDLIVVNQYPTDSKGTIDNKAALYGFKDVAQQEQVAKIAPIVTIVMGGDGADVITRTTELATSLGAKASTVAAAKTTYTAATAALKTATAASDVQVTALYGDADGVYVAKAPDDPSLRLYSDLGVHFTKPTPAGYYWGVYSWENAGKIGGDLVLVSERGYQKADLLKQPTFKATPAAKADQIQPWVFAGMDYVSQTAYLNQLAGYITAAKVVTG